MTDFQRRRGGAVNPSPNKKAEWPVNNQKVRVSLPVIEVRVKLIHQTKAENV